MTNNIEQEQKEENIQFLKTAGAIAIPVAAQSFLTTILNLIDSLMIGRLGESTIAAVGLANKVFFVFTLILFGISSGAGALAAQYWGSREKDKIQKVLGFSLVIALGTAFFFVAVCIMAPQMVMSIFTPEKQTIETGAVYLRLVVFSYPLTAISMCYISVFRAVKQVKAPVVISLVSITINAAINYTLIFGKFGAPVLGVAGAAIGTLIARIAECTLMIILAKKTDSPAAAGFRELLDWDKNFLVKYMKTTFPVIANEFAWGLGVTMYSLVYGRMGDEAVAAITITQTFEEVMTVIFHGLSAATGVILGNIMGSGALEKAERYAAKFLKLQFVCALITAVALYLLRWPVIGLYTVSNQVAHAISLCFLGFIAATPSKMFNYVTVVGILRSGGDTVFSFLLDFCCVWFYGIPMAYLGGILLKQPIEIVYAMVMSEEVVKMFFSAIRYKQKKWLKNLTV